MADDPRPRGEYDSSILPVTEALARILKAVHPVTCVERVALRSALDRVLAADLLALRPVPPYDNSAMDGYALRAADLPRADDEPLSLIGTALAGRPYEGTMGSGECVRIMTGAILPAGADTVVMQEHTRRVDDAVFLAHNPRRGDNVRHVGDDLGVGQTILPAGRRLTPVDLGVLASLGVVEVGVWRRPRVSFFSTGDELCSLGDPLETGQIYDSNRYTLHAMLTRLGVEVLDLGIIRDCRSDLSLTFGAAAQVSDAVITSGGVSVGEADLVKETLEAMGQVEFWKIAMKPGKPLAFGQIGAALFFGLPGNPVSVMVTFYHFVQPALRRLAGELPRPPLRLRARCLDYLSKRPGRTDFQRGVLGLGPDGELTVRSTGDQGSHILSSMGRADCFIILPLETGDVAPGSLVDVEPFTSLV
jgi:molybdopterin molybdotransferase